MARATDASTAELRDARLIIARELGFPTWRELVEGAEKSQRDAAERQERWRRMRPETEDLLAGDTGRLAQLTAGRAPWPKPCGRLWPPGRPKALHAA